MDACTLPLEICIHVVQQLADAGELHHLKTTSLVCCAWRDFVQPLIFETPIVVDSRRVSATKWAERMALAPHLGHLISGVCLQGYPDPAIELLASRLRKVVSLKFPESGILPTGPPNLLYRIQRLNLPMGPSPTRLISLLTSMPNLCDLSLSLSPDRWKSTGTEKSAEEWQLASRMLLQGETNHVKLRRLSVSTWLAAPSHIEHLLDFLLLPHSFNFRHLRILVIHWKWSILREDYNLPTSTTEKLLDFSQHVGQTVEHLVIVHDDYYNHSLGSTKADMLAKSGFMLSFPTLQRLEFTLLENSAIWRDQGLIDVDGLGGLVYLEPLRGNNSLRIVDINLVFEVHRLANGRRWPREETRWLALDTMLSNRSDFQYLERVNVIIGQGTERQHEANNSTEAGARNARVSLVHEKLPRLFQSNRLVVSHVSLLY